MSAPEATSRSGVLTTRGWPLVVRGAAAIVFGLLAVLARPADLFALVIVWGLYALVDGMAGTVAAVWAGGDGLPCGWLDLEGMVSVATGVLTLSFSPRLSAIGLVSVIAAWAVATGCLEVVGAIRTRRLAREEQTLAAAGAVACTMGLVSFLVAGAGTPAQRWVIGGYAFLFGALLIILGVGARRWSRCVVRTRR